MDPITQQTVLAAAGAAGGDPLYVDDVFSTFLYKGNGTARSINNGIDLAGEGGLVWIKNRDNGYQDHVLNDTERGAGQTLRSDSSNGQFLSTARFSAFNSNGFSVGTDSGTNNNNEDIVSWTFRKAPGFFDVVTYTGNGTAGRTVAHSLGSVPGMIIVKCTSAQEDWTVYHRSIGATKNLRLNETDAERTETNKFNDTEPTATQFTLGFNSLVNGSGQTYVAYIFAHDDAQFGTDEDESIIKCGSFTGGGTLNNPKFIDIGFEAQFVLWKRTDSSSQGDWYMNDSMRGMARSFSNQPQLQANNTDAEGSSYGFWAYQNGFAFSEDLGGTSADFVYMAIRRPNKPPEAGTDVFNAKLRTGTGTTGQIDSGIGFAPDLAIIKSRNVGTSGFFYDRLRGDDKYLQSSSSDPESSGGLSLTSATGTVVIGGSAGWHSENSRTFVDLYLKRAPGFFDVVAYSGDATSNRAVPHNLKVTPELLILKRRQSEHWMVQYTGVFGTNTALRLSTNAAASAQAAFNSTSAATASNFYVGSDSSANGSTSTYIAYLFATLPGISKVGSYTGTGSTINVNCGFTAGARFVLTKRTDFATDWVFYDTARGIVSGNDPALTLNANDADYTTYDFIDPLNSGFTLNASGFSNQSGGNYIFLAIA